MKKKSYFKPSFIFGPVPSRRLKVSLGIDLIPYKTCTLNCIYCESGKTTDLRIRRKRFVDPQMILDEYKDFLDGNKYSLDFVTFSGSGEPTLSSDLGYLIREIKKLADYPVAVLTNGTLLYCQEVRKELSAADVVIPSLDAVNERIFKRINQPHSDLNINKVKEGLVKFSQEYQGELWIEIFLVKGINDDKKHLKEMYEFLKTLNFKKVQLNSIDRPPAFDQVETLSYKELEDLKESWKELKVEIIKRVKRRGDVPSFCQNLENSILNTIIRRPLTINDLMSFTQKKKIELNKYIDILIKEGKIKRKIIKDEIFFCSK